MFLRLGRAVGATLGLAAQTQAAGDLGARAQAHPRREVLVAGKARHVRPGLADDGQRGGHVQAVDARQVHAAHLEQLRARVELGRIAGPAALLAFGRIALVNLQLLQLRFDFLVALASCVPTKSNAPSSSRTLEVALATNAEVPLPDARRTSRRRHGESRR